MKNLNWNENFEFLGNISYPNEFLYNKYSLNLFSRFDSQINSLHLWEWNSCTCIKHCKFNQILNTNYFAHFGNFLRSWANKIFKHCGVSTWLWLGHIGLVYIWIWMNFVLLSIIFERILTLKPCMIYETRTMISGLDSMRTLEWVFYLCLRLGSLNQKERKRSRT